MKVRFSKIAVVIAALALLLAACGDNDDGSSEAATDDTEAPAGDETGDETDEDSDEPCPGTRGCTPVFPEGEDIKVGVLSPGDTNDNGYYESFVVAAREYAEEKGWETIILDRVATADATDQVRNLCRQGAQFVALADDQVADGMTAAEEDVCEGVVFYINTDAELTPYAFNTTDDIYESQMTAGFATGLAMRELGATSAAFIGGPDLDFVTQAFDSWTAGIKQVIPEATTSKTLTGSFDDSALGQEAAKAQIAQGAEVLYPYLGGATDAVAKAGLDEGVYSIAPGTDRCDDPAYVASSLFPPGEFFLQAIKAWETGEVKMGESFHNKVGVQDIPSAVICDNGNVEDAEGLQAELDDFMAKIGSDEIVPSEIVKG